ncbi:MAG: GNAT family N-acetyltransferase [Bacteroidia bacterium]|nr:GNAT family N-acetyltransferase [Bacteroidia bacterium]
MIAKLATEDWEFEQMFGLNYQTFVNEIPQHSQNQTGLLVDKFHDKNKYIIVLQGKDLIGMMAINENRPFSLDQKLENMDALLPPFKNGFEIRLLAVKSEYRGGVVFLKLFAKLAEIIKEKNYDIGLISGILSQQKLYTKIGFVPFGPLVGKDDARFQPMYITLDRYLNGLEKMNLAGKIY